MIHQLARNHDVADDISSTLCESDAGAFDKAGRQAGIMHAVDYGLNVQNAVAELLQCMAMEYKCRANYGTLACMTDDPDVAEPLRFLRQRSIVHFQRFGEALVSIQSRQSNHG